MRGSLAAALGALVWATVVLPLATAQNPTIQITVETPSDPTANGTMWVGELDVTLSLTGLACPTPNTWTLFLEPSTSGSNVTEATAIWTPASLEFEVPAGQYAAQPYEGTLPSVLRVTYPAPGNVTIETAITATWETTSCVPPPAANAGSTQSMVFTFGPSAESPVGTELAMPAPGWLWAVAAVGLAGAATTGRRR